MLQVLPWNGCLIKGSDPRSCEVSTKLNFRTNHDVPREIHPLQDWSSTLLRAHGDLCQWSSDVSNRLDGVVPCDDVRHAGVVTTCSKSSRPFCHGLPHVNDILVPDSQSSWWTQSALPRVSPGMVHGVIICVSTLLRPSLDFGLLEQHSNAQCVVPSGPSGHIGKTVLPSSLARTLALPLRRTFRSTAASRRDPSARVRFSCDPDRAPSQQEILDRGLTHFSTVGSSGSSVGWKHSPGLPWPGLMR